MDEEFEKLKNSNLKSRRLKVIEEIKLAEGALEDSKKALKKCEEQVGLILVQISNVQNSVVHMSDHHNFSSKF